jgi:RNA polymerase sigma-70 factor (ECF subfamily)
MEPHSSEPPPSGVRPSFEHLFPFAHRYVRHSVRELGVPDRDCDDVTQDVLIAVHRGLYKYDPTRPLKPWLKTITYRIARDYRALSRNKREMLFPGAEAQITDSGPSSEEQLMQAQARRVLFEILHTVEADRRLVFILHDIEDVAMDEIAASMEIPVNTARSRLRTARIEVQAALDRRRAQENRQRKSGALLFPLGLSELISAGKHLPELSPEDHQRLWTTVQEALSAAPEEPSAEPERPDMNRGLDPAAIQIAPAKLVGAALLVFSLGAATGAALMRPPATPATELARADLSPGQMAGSLPPSTGRYVPLPSAPDSAPAASSAGPPPPSSAPRPAPSGTAADRLKKETRLLEAAGAAMDRGDLRGARDHLNQYGRDFPRGDLAEDYRTLRERLHALERSGNGGDLDAGTQTGAGGP